MNIAEIVKTEFKTFKDMQKVLKTNEDYIKYLEELIWEGVPVSPFDKNSKVYKCKKGKYKCKNTGKYFTVLTGTIFENTKVGLDIWFEVIFLLQANRRGVASTTIARMLGITQTTAWYMLQKIRNSMRIENDHVLQGIVEVDEYYAGGRFSNMHYDKKLAAKASGPFQNKIPVHGLVQRGGDAVIKVVPNFEADTLNANVLRFVRLGSTLYTDENLSYKRIARFYNHDFVVHSKGNYFKSDKDEEIHTNSIESVWASLDRTLKLHIKVSQKHLQNYANGCVFRYNTRKMKPMDACIWLLQNIESSKITWENIQRAEYGQHNRNKARAA